LRERGGKLRYVVLGVRGGERHAQARGPRRDAGRPDRRHQQAAPGKLAGGFDGRFWRADDDGMDRGFRSPCANAAPLTLAAELRDPCLEVRDERAIGIDEIHGAHRNGGGHRRQRRCVYVGACALREPFDHLGLAAYERAIATERLAERGHIHDARRANAEALERPVPAVAHDTDAMRVVEHEPCVVALAQREELDHRRHISVHAEHRIGGHDARCRGGSSSALSSASRSRCG
jgi:hypothetical protein